MKLKQLFALALFSTLPTFASASFLVDFEKTWDYANGGVNDYYNCGTAADLTSGANLGVSFTGVSGLSNDSSFTYYSGAPSMQGIAYAYASSPADTAFMNVAAGVDTGLSFFYSSTDAVTGAVKAYSGLNGAGTLLGTFDLAANDSGNSLITGSGAYTTWTPATFRYSGTAQSFDFTASANIVGFDNISSVPEPSLLWLFGRGGASGIRRDQPAQESASLKTPVLKVL